MPERPARAHQVVPPQHPSPTEKAERKQRVLTHAAPAITPSIADAVVIKDGSLFCLTLPDGDVPLGGGHGFGLYCHDCRFLDGYELRAAGCEFAALAATASRGYMATIELANPDLRMPDRTLIPKETVGVRWDRVLDGHDLVLRERLTITNYGMQRIGFPLSLTFAADFEDIFIVRGMLQEHTGSAERPRWHHGDSGARLSFLYHGVDGQYRATTVALSPKPERTHGQCAEFAIALGSHERATIAIAIAVTEGADRKAVADRQPPAADLGLVVRNAGRSARAWLDTLLSVRTDSALFDRLLRRSLRDLELLRTSIDGTWFFAAGVPWFVALFGRDSVITAIQLLAFDHAVAEQTLRLLARFQGDRIDAWREEEPGKMLHELRVGELARAGEIPYTPYYGTVDATPLWLILLARHAAWTGKLALFRELRTHVDRALEWIDRYGDVSGDGYVAYRSRVGTGLVNQGWKDSGDAIVNADGSLARPPIELVEVQSYVYEAKRSMAELFERAGETSRARELSAQAESLRQRFNRDFWLPDAGIYALARQKDGVPVAVVSSNPGHALWTGIADRDKARSTCRRLCDSDMHSGWGIRTLSRDAVRYNPVAYHLGTVWPHDNSIIAMGFRRYGFDASAARIAAGIMEAAARFEHDRLPELFAGFSRARFGIPVRYPVADHPQAWGAGSIPYLLHALLGLEPEAFSQRLRIIRPLLTDDVRHLELHGLRVGDASVDLAFRREGDGVAVDVLAQRGPLEIIVEREGNADAGPGDDARDDSSDGAADYGRGESAATSAVHARSAQR